MKNRMAAFLLGLTIAFLLAGCYITDASSTAQSETPIEPSAASEQTVPFGMELVGGSLEERFSYYRDTVTDTIFVFCRSSTANSQGCGFTVMLDPESGKPLTYTRYMELANAQQ